MLFFLRNISDLPVGMILTLLTGMILALLIGMTVHEWAHNYVGHLMGDPNPKRLGKLTLNPLKHIFWQGFLMFLLIGFGILGTAPIAAYRMRNPRLGYLLAVAAGPLSNLALAGVAALIFRLIVGVFNIPMHLVNAYQEAGAGSASLIYALPETFRFLPDSSAVGITLAIIMGQIVMWNLLLFVFNFLPFSPMDGWHIVLSLLPPQPAIWWKNNAQVSMFIFFGLLLLGYATDFNVIGMIISEPVDLLIGIFT